MNSRRAAGVRMVLIAFCSFALAFAAAAVGWTLTDRTAASPGQSAAIASLADAAPLRRELLMIYIGSSTCGPSNSPTLRRDIRQISALLATRAATAGRSFVTVGVAVDRRASAGVEHLRAMGPFDELAAGGGWANAHALKYVWEEWPGIAGTPQIVVIDRHLRVERDAPGGVRYSSGAERLVVRMAGLWEISRWRRSGAPLPDLP